MSARRITKGSRAASGSRATTSPAETSSGPKGDPPRESPQAPSARRAPAVTLFAAALAALAASTQGCLLDSSGRGEETPGAGGSGAGTTQTGGSDTTGTGGDGGSGASGGGSGASTGTGGTTGTTGTGASTGTGGGPVDGDVCPGAPFQISPAGDLLIQGDTTGAVNDYASQVCGGAQGTDLVYAITTTAAGTLTLTLQTADGLEAVAYMRSVCDDVNSLMLCTPSGAQVGVSVPQGTQFVFVDGQNMSSGAFLLTLSLDVNVCGDGYIGAGEECDDGNAVNGDTCNSACQVICDESGLGAVNGYAFEDPDSHHCYLYVFAPAESWTKAQATCQQWGDDLAALSTEQEIADVADVLARTNEDVWIGGSDLAVEGSFQWVNGEAWIYQNGLPPWDDPLQGAAEPNGGTLEGCLEIYPNGEINDAQCGLQQTYLCERAPAGKAL